MTHYFLKRHLALAGVKEEKPETPFGPGNLSNVARCCEKARPTQCVCDYWWWVCPDHKRRGACHPTNSHD